MRGADDRVAVLDHGPVQAPHGDVDLCARDRFSRRRTVYLAAPDKRKQLLVDDRLFIINMDTIVRYEDTGRSAVSFRVDELIERIDGRQPGRAGLCSVLFGLKDCEARALDLCSVFAGASK